MAPIEPASKWPSEMFVHSSPASTVFHTPPPVAPMKNVCGCSVIPATAVLRPPRGGPIDRYSSPASMAESKAIPPSWAERSMGVSAVSAAATAIAGVGPRSTRARRDRDPTNGTRRLLIEVLLWRETMRAGRDRGGGPTR